MLTFHVELGWHGFKLVEYQSLDQRREILEVSKTTPAALLDLLKIAAALNALNGDVCGTLGVSDDDLINQWAGENPKRYSEWKLGNLAEANASLGMAMAIAHAEKNND